MSAPAGKNPIVCMGREKCLFRVNSVGELLICCEKGSAMFTNVYACDPERRLGFLLGFPQKAALCSPHEGEDSLGK